MKPNRAAVMLAKDVLHDIVCGLFVAAIVLATAPVWRFLVLGFNPTIDMLLQSAICGGPIG